MKTVVRLLTTVVVLAVSAPAQFRDLATDHAGERVWFSSPLSLDGREYRSGAGNIYVANRSGAVELLVDSPGNWQRPQVSADGRRFAAIGEVGPLFGQTCPACRPQSLVRTDGETERTYEGRIEMSRNGRFLLRHGYAYFGPTEQVELIEVDSDEVIPWSIRAFEPIGPAPKVADDGSALVSTGTLWILRRNGTFDFVYAPDFGIEQSPFFTSFIPPWVTLSASGERVLYHRIAQPPRIALTGPAQEEEPRDILKPTAGAIQPMLSADSSRVLFLSPADFGGANTEQIQQAWISDLEGGNIRPAVLDRTGVAEAVLSGDGRVVWAVTYGGRLLRRDLDAEDAEEIVPRTALRQFDPVAPFVDAPRGGFLTLTGRGLAPRTEVSGLPLSTELAGVRLEAEGRPLRLLSVSPTEIRAQIPWDEPRDQIQVRAFVGTDSLFDDSVGTVLNVRPVDSLPRWELTAEGLPAIAHGDFRGLVSDADRARPGEVIHLFLTGLGAVENPPEAGEAAPLSPLSRLTGQVEVALEPNAFSTSPGSAVQVEMLFAGLAPGMVGLYQVSIRLPAEGLTHNAVVRVGGLAAILPVLP